MDVIRDFVMPWVPVLFGVGTVLLVAGLLTKEMASDPSVNWV
jgi:hypothetical protein